MDRTFIVYDVEKQDQHDSDFCVGFGFAYLMQAIYKIILAGAYIFAMAKKDEGSFKTWGTSILRAGMAVVRYGVPAEFRWKYQSGRRDYFANWQNIPADVHVDAIQRAAVSLYQIEILRGWTVFDTLIAYLWKLRILIDTGNNNHNITVIGYVNSNWNGLNELPEKLQKIIRDNNIKDRLICADSYGGRTYYQGYRFIDREEARTLFTPYFLMKNPRELAKLLSEYGGKGVKTADSPDIYAVYDGEKHLIPNEFAMWCWGIYGLPEPQDIYVLDLREFDAIPTGATVTAEDGRRYVWSHHLIHRVLDYAASLDYIDRAKIEEIKDKIINSK